MILSVTDFPPLSVSPWGKQRGFSGSTPMCVSSFPGDVGTPGNGQAGHAVDRTLVVHFDNCRPQSSISGHRDGAAISTHTPENILPPPPKKPMSWFVFGQLLSVQTLSLFLVWWDLSSVKLASRVFPQGTRTAQAWMGDRGCCTSGWRCARGWLSIPSRSDMGVLC